MTNIYFAGYNDLITMYWGMNFDDSAIPNKWKTQECVFVENVTGQTITGEHGKEQRYCLPTFTIVVLYIETKEREAYLAMTPQDYKIFKQYYDCSCIERT